MKSAFSSRINPSSIIKQQFETQVQQMKKDSFKPFNVSKCQIHILPRDHICLNQKCQYFNQLLCQDCPHCIHSLICVNKIVPILSQWIFRQYGQIQKQNKKLTDQWNIVSQNIRYCIDIFQQLLKIIENHVEKKIYAPKKFIDIINVVHGMFTHDSSNGSPEIFLKNWNHLQKKYHLFEEKRQSQMSDKENQSWMNIKCETLQNEKHQRLSHALNANKKSKTFSQKALLFSQSLAQLIESKVKEQQHKNHIKELKIKNQLCLKDLLQKYNTVEQSSETNTQLAKILQNIETFNMELSGKDNSKQQSLQYLQTQLSQISKLRNLKQLKINNKNGRIHHKMWYCILNYFQMLKFLKDLKLILTQKDLPFLLNLFKEKEKAVRQIQSLTLHINDQKQLDLTKVNQFLNTLQLRRLNLNLSRNNLEFKKVFEFLKKLKVYTSMSQLPLIECKIILTANRIHVDEKIQLQQLFKQKCKDVKINLLTL